MIKNFDFDEKNFKNNTENIKKYLEKLIELHNKEQEFLVKTSDCYTADKILVVRVVEIHMKKNPIIFCRGRSTHPNSQERPCTLHVTDIKAMTYDETRKKWLLELKN
ncbi:hypothetical protein Calhy_0333 [Caldicellulosiruptor hydrothermalis 108]|uniref:Uncharacterized protein n=1 Tax=Caldicellulosiruptor hydrothermalis (strain DSM 18901 / VKM B-2411 / 108) TaxID=632292 RepID=E4QBH9_CALH1|nr:hypothetical protein [Caldicellulosiruptor hydrothermalis]ADQ06081.1 hypothetical protein Calhy_0333 [Caldicellulosiruptor hydrothermalis 108]